MFILFSYYQLQLTSEVSSGHVFLFISLDAVDPVEEVGFITAVQSKQRTDSNQIMCGSLQIHFITLLNSEINYELHYFFSIHIQLNSETETNFYYLYSTTLIEL